jgi:hypothetical protein
MSRWRALVIAALAAAVSIGGVALLLAVNAEVSGEATAAAPPAGAVHSERISPPGVPAAPTPGRPVPRPMPGPGAARNEGTPPPSFRVGGFPTAPSPGLTTPELPMPALAGGGEDDEELQRQLATRRLAALERRVRAMNRRITSMGDRSTPDQLQAQKERMESLLEEIRQKREEQGLPPFRIEEDTQAE